MGSLAGHANRGRATRWAGRNPGKVLARYQWEVERDRLRKKARGGKFAKLPDGEEPERDAITAHILDVFLLVNRSRQYVNGLGGGVPLPLSVADITAVLEAHPSP